MSLWFRRPNADKKKPIPVETAQVPSTLQVPAEVYENAAATVVGARRQQHWLDEAINECAQNGGLDHLKGKGKPISIPDGDVLSSVLKEANVLPPWLELQHEIRDDLRAYLGIGGATHSIPSKSPDLDSINSKISRYNMLVPTPILQKGRLKPDTAEKQLKLWE